MRAPHLATNVLHFLTNRHLCQARTVNKTWSNFIDHEKFFWRRVFRKYKEWNTVTNKLGSQVIKLLGKCYLHYAFEKNYNNVTRHRCHPIFCAIATKNTKIFQQVLELFPEYKSETCQGMTPLGFAAHAGNLDVFKDLLVEDLFGEKYAQVQTLLHYAASGGNLEVCQLLLEKGGDFGLQNDSGITPIQQAVQNGHIEICRLQKYHHFTNNGLDEPFHQSIAFRIEGSTLLHLAAAKGHIEICKLFSENEFSLIQDRLGRTPLYHAVKEGHIEICHFFFEKIIGDVNQMFNQGVTLFHIAAESGNFELCEIFITRTCGSKNPKDLSGRTPLHQASFGGHLNVCMLILEKTKDVNPRDIQGITPLHLAAEAGHLRICEFIVSKMEGDKNPADENGDTPLHYAAKVGKLRICKFFIEDVKITKFTRNKKGHTPKDSAKRMNRDTNDSDLIDVCDFFEDNARARLKRKADSLGPPPKVVIPVIERRLAERALNE